jgi:hypothetical protein
MTNNIVYKRLPTRYGVIANEDESEAYGPYDIIVPEQYIDKTTEDLLPFVKEKWQPVLDRMKAERDKEISDYLDTIADDENDLKELRKKKLKEQLEYIKQKGKYDDLLARFKAADKTKTLIIPADVSAWSRWYFDTKAPDNDNELTKWAEEKIKASWPTGVMRYSPTVQLLGKHGIRYPAGANLGDFAGRAGIDLMSIPIDTPLGMVSLYNSLKSNARDTLTQFPAAVLNTLQEKYGGLDKIVTSFSESPVNTFIDILGALSLAKGIGKVASHMAAAFGNPRVKSLIPLAEDAAQKGRAITPEVLKEVSNQKYDAIRKNEINNLNKLIETQTKMRGKLADLQRELANSKVDDMIAIDKKLDMLNNELDTIGNEIAVKRQKYNVELDTLPNNKELVPYQHQLSADVPVDQKIIGITNKIDDMVQQSKKIAEEANARIGGDIQDLDNLMGLQTAGHMGYLPSSSSNKFDLANYASQHKTLQDTIDATMHWPGIDPIIVKGTALQPQHIGVLPLRATVNPQVVRREMRNRIDDIIAELIDVQNRKKRAKSKVELDRLDSQLNELENQLRNELGGYLQP